MRQTRSFAWVALGLCFTAACGGDDEDSAVDKCNTLQTTVCTRIADCSVEGGLIGASERDAAYDDCSSGVEQGLDCSNAVDVSSSYDTCIDDLNGATCDTVVAFIQDPENVGLPDSCSEVILLE